MDASFFAIGMLNEARQREQLRSAADYERYFANVDTAVNDLERLQAAFRWVGDLIRWIATPRPKFHPANA